MERNRLWNGDFPTWSVILQGVGGCSENRAFPTRHRQAQAGECTLSGGGCCGGEEEAVAKRGKVANANDLLTEAFNCYRLPPSRDGREGRSKRHDGKQ